MRENLKAVSGHGVFPLLIGALIAATGHSQMFWRSLGVLLCAVWLSLDVGLWISKAKWKEQYKAILFCAATCMLCVLAMCFMRGFLLSTLEDQQANVDGNITARASLSPSGAVWNSVFSVTNSSSFDLNYAISCGARLIVDANQNVFSRDTFLATATGILERGGDADSSQCLSAVSSQTPVMCADVDLRFDYALETQPATHKSKRFRFMGYRESGNFEWYRKADDYRGSYCSRFVKRPLGSLP